MQNELSVKTVQYNRILVVGLLFASLIAAKTAIADDAVKNWLVNDVFEIKSQEAPEQPFELENHASDPNTGNQVVAVSSNGFYRWAVVNLKLGNKLLYTKEMNLNDRGLSVYKASFSADGKYLAVVQGNRTFEINYYDMAQMKLVSTDDIYSIESDEALNYQIKSGLFAAKWQDTYEILVGILSQVSGYSGIGSVSSTECINSKPCIFVYFENSDKENNFKQTFPNGLKVNGVLVETALTFELELGH